MDTQKLKAVLLAAEYKSLSKAAEVFSYTPSALSHSVDVLEQTLGVKLLQRTHTGVSWTQEGQRLRDKLRAVLDAEEDLLSCAAALTQQKRKQLRIGTFTSISVNLLPELLNGFRAQNPDVGISIQVGNELGDWLDRDTVDVVFGAKNPNHVWQPLIEDQFVAVLPQGAFPGRRSVRAEELFSYSFIITENTAVERSMDLTRFREIIRLNSDDDLAAVALVEEGMGVTALPSLVLKKRPRHVQVLKLEPRLYRTLGLSWRKDLPPDSAAAQFIRYLSLQMPHASR